MNRGACFLAFTLVLCPALRADVMASTSIGLTGLTITPDTGTVSFFPGTSATAFGAVLDDPLGGSAFDGPNTAFDDVASANASTGLASGSASVSGSGFTANAFSSISLSGMNGRADSEANGQLAGIFQILDGGTDTDPVNVAFAATLAANQSLLTDAFGISATSQVTFQLSIPDFGLILFSNNPLAIGPSDSLSQASTSTVTNSFQLQFNTPYSIFAEVDSESSGIDSNPEPSTIILMTTGLAGLLAARRRRKL